MNTLYFILQRYSDNRDSTLGLLFKVVSAAEVKRPHFFCYTLEDQYQVIKVPKETRIQANRYELKLLKIETPKTLQYRNKFPWFMWHIEVIGVPGFTRVYLHIGNDDEDTDACILLGDNADNNTIGPGSISNSTQAFKRFYNEVTEWLSNGNKAFIDIRDEIKLL